jgi:flagellar hook-associated protein 2
MSDLLSALTSSLEDTSNMTQSELIAYTYKKTEQPKVDALNERRQSLEQKQVFFNQLNTKISSLMSAIDAFGKISGDKYNLSFDKVASADSKFVTRNIATSDSSVLTASASSSALLGVNTIKVNRLATNDVLVAQSLDLASDFALTGEHTFNMNGKNVTVDFGESTISNEAAMKKIASAINATEDIGMSASLVKSTTTKGRLTFTATETGTTRTVDGEEVTNDIQFVAGSDVLKELGLGNNLINPDNKREVYKENQPDKAYYKVADPNELNSEIVVNSVVVTRSSNTVTDALEGVTLNLHKAQDDEDMEINVTTTVGTSKVKEMLQPLLTAYNDLLGFLDENKSLQRSDASVSSLRQMIRSLPSQEVSSVQSADGDEDVPSFLTEIGLSIDKAGKIYIDDNEKLEGFLEDDPQKVADLFISSDGFAAKLNKAVYSYTGTDSIIAARKDSLSQQIQTTTKRTEELQARIDSQAEALRKEYDSMLEVFLQAQAQYQMLGTYGSSGSSMQYY